MATPKDKDETQEKIIKALQEVYKGQNELFNEIDKLKETIEINTQALVILNKWFTHLQEFEKQVFKHWLRDDGHDKNPPKNYPYGL